MAADLREIKNVAIEDDGRWFKLFAEELKGPQTGRFLSRPYVEIAANDYDTVLEVERVFVRVIAMKRAQFLSPRALDKAIYEFALDR
jgi:hypothetical protein